MRVDDRQLEVELRRVQRRALGIGISLASFGGGGVLFSGAFYMIRGSAWSLAHVLVSVACLLVAAPLLIVACPARAETELTPSVQDSDARADRWLGR